MDADIHLHIDELVLEGVAAGERQAVAAVVQSELARLLGAGPVANITAGRARVDGGVINVRPGAPPHQMGAAVAQAIYRGISQ